LAGAGTMGAWPLATAAPRGEEAGRGEASSPAAAASHVRTRQGSLTRLPPARGGLAAPAVDGDRRGAPHRAR
jgi:hypothetical protein